jgi:hypothetical protein
MRGTRAVVALGLLFAPACARTLRVETTQPNPILLGPDNAHQSRKLVIDVRDMDLPSTFTMRQSAYFAVVSRDRVRFHVSLVHKWEECADVTTWKVKLTDDKGNVYLPEAAEKRYDDHITRMWDHDRVTAVRDRYGDIVRLRNDGYKRRVALDSADVFQGTGDYMFHSKGMFDRGVKRLTLELSRGLGEPHYIFTWNLTDEIPVPDADEPVAAAASH